MDNKKICRNRIIPEYVPADLPRCERDGLVTYEENRGAYLQNLQVVNFDMIHDHCSGTPLSKTETFYKTVQKKDLKIFRKKKKMELLQLWPDVDVMICRYNET